MNQPSSGSTSPTADRFGSGDTKPTPQPGDRRPISEADFTLDDLLMPDDELSTSPTDGQASIFGDAMPLLDAGSDFLRDYPPPAANGSNIFADPSALEADADASMVSFDPTGGGSVEDSLNGQIQPMPIQDSDQFLEELEDPFPPEMPAHASWNDDDADDDADDDVMSFHDLPQVPGPGSTLFESDIQPVAGSRFDDGQSAVSFDLPRPTRSQMPTEPEPRRPQPVPVPTAWVPAEPRPSRRLPSWLGPVGGGVVGAGVTAVAFALTVSEPKPVVMPAPIVVAAPTPVPAATTGIDPKQLTDARAETERLRQESLQKLKAERRATLAAGQARDEATKQLTAERARVRHATEAAATADTSRIKSEAALARLSLELSELKANRGNADDERLLQANTEAAANRDAAATANRALTEAKAAAETAERKRVELESQLSAQVAARVSLEAKLAAANTPREPTATITPPPQPVATPAEANPALASELLSVGFEQYSAGRFADAERTLREAVARGTDARACYFLGFARYHLGQDPTEAFRRGIELERRGLPHTREVTPILEGVDRAARAALGVVR